MPCPASNCVLAGRGGSAAGASEPFDGGGGGGMAGASDIFSLWIPLSLISISFIDGLR